MDSMPYGTGIAVLVMSTWSKMAAVQPQRSKKRKAKVVELQSKGSSNDVEETDVIPKPKKMYKWSNKQRVLVFCARGVTSRARHLMMDLRTLMPHSKSDTKLDRKDSLPVINEVCETKNCNKCVFFQMRKKQDLYMWMAEVPSGPSAKFLIENIHTMNELKMTGNCLKGSRPLLTFDSMFDKLPYLKCLKELFIQVFGTPYYHPKSKPFVDHVFHFSVIDNKIWFRNYQIINGGTSLVEIGPRFVMNVIKIFGGSFSGVSLFENPHYIPPNIHRRLLKKKAGMKYRENVDAKLALAKRKDGWVYQEDPVEDIFDE